MTKRFLAPVLALIGFGLTARANLTTYCDGGGCSTNTTAAFETAVTSGGLTYANATDLTFTGSLTGTTQYSDGLTSLVFSDSDGFGITGSNGLQENGSADTITIAVPAQYSALRLSLVAAGPGFFFTCLDANCNTTTNLTANAQEVGFFTSTPGSSWTVTFSSGSPDRLIINSFNPAGAASTSDTPEVSTLLLIGAGLTAMRWMKRRPRRFFRTLTA